MYFSAPPSPRKILYSIKTSKLRRSKLSDIIQLTGHTRMYPKVCIHLKVTFEKYG